MQRISLGAEALADLPKLTNAALQSARKNPKVGCLIDHVYPGRPLIMTFGYVDWLEPPNFDFFGRIKKFEALHHTCFNHLFLRDSLNAWYHRGIPGLGSHVDEVAGTLRGLIRSMGVSRVITIGQSMGGYAAIMFGLLLGADQVVAFGPLSHLNPDEALRYGDRRFLNAMQDLRANPPKSVYEDLSHMLKTFPFHGDLHLFYGTHPGHDDGVSGNFDALHAFRLAHYKRTFLYPYPAAGHPIIQWLIDQRQIDEVLARMLLLQDLDLSIPTHLPSSPRAMTSWENRSWPPAKS